MNTKNIKRNKNKKTVQTNVFGSICNRWWQLHFQTEKPFVSFTIPPTMLMTAILLNTNISKKTEKSAFINSI